MNLTVEKCDMYVEQLEAFKETKECKEFTALCEKQKEKLKEELWANVQSWAWTKICKSQNDMQMETLKIYSEALSVLAETKVDVIIEDFENNISFLKDRITLEWPTHWSRDKSLISTNDVKRVRWATYDVLSKSVDTLINRYKWNKAAINQVNPYEDWEGQED